MQTVEGISCNIEILLDIVNKIEEEKKNDLILKNMIYYLVQMIYGH